jgi:hypothetical protein
VLCHLLQLASAKKCGHLGGKVLVPTSEFVQKLQAARLAADVCDTPTVIIARTDALGAYLLTSDVDDRDKPFCSGEYNLLLITDPGRILCADVRIHLRQYVLVTICSHINARGPGVEVSIYGVLSVYRPVYRKAIEWTLIHLPCPSTTLYRALRVLCILIAWYASPDLCILCATHECFVLLLGTM